MSTRSPEFSRQMALRVRNLAAAYAHPSCKALLVHTRAEIARIDEWLSRLRLDGLGEELRAKVKLFYPAAAPADPDLVRRKWERPDLVRVIFCGRGFEAKRGRWALDVFRAVGEQRPDVECVYIGDVPARHTDLPNGPGFRYHPALEHDAVLDLFARSHILFHPGENESVGAVLIEAAAAGMAVVTAHGIGMEHTTEWFDDDGGALVERARVTTLAEEERAFRERLFALLADRDRAKRHGLANYRTATQGVLSLERRDRVLLDAYEDCRRSRSEPFSLDAIERLPDSRTCRLISRDLIKAIRTYRQSIGFTRFQMDFTFEPD